MPPQTPSLKPSEPPDSVRTRLWHLRVDLQHRIEYAGLRLIIGLVRAMPLDRAVALSARMWRLLAPYGRRHRRALDNLARAFPEKSPAEREQIALAMWANLGRVMAETMQIDRVLEDPDRVEFLDERAFSRYRGKLGPVIGVTLHMGNWELATWPLTRWGGHPAAVYRLVKNPYVDRFLRHQRRELFPGGLLAKGSAYGGDKAEGQRTARLIMDYVRRGGRLGLVCDLFDRQGIPVDFFGHPANTTPIAAMIARRVGSRIWMARCTRVGEGSHFQLHVKELKVTRSADQAADIREITAAMQRQFEAWIRDYPEQWMWSNRRWS